MEIRAQYTEALVAQATKRFWLRFIGWHGFAAVGVLAVIDGYLLAVEGASSIAMALTCVLLLAVFVGTAVYFVYQNRALDTLRRMGSPEAVFTVGPEGLTSRSALGGSDLSWRAITPSMRCRGS